MFSVGSRVVAAILICEANFNGVELWIHANRGELGVVMGVDGEWSTVTWYRTGTTTDVHLDDLLLKSHQTATVIVRA